MINHIAGYGADKTKSSTISNDFTDYMENASNTQKTDGTLILHYFDNEEGDTAISACGALDGSSVTVYQAKDFDPEHPIYKVKIWDASGNVTERMVDIAQVNPEQCDAVDMYAYSCYLSVSGECPDAIHKFMGAKANYFDSNNDGNLFDKADWLEVVKEIMQMQYDVGNLKGYLEYKEFLSFLIQ